MFEFLGGVITGILLLIGYGAYRALRSDGWDNSNILNWLRLLSHVFIHPEDFGEMYYKKPDGSEARPFGYISGDEFADHFPDSRP